MRYTNLHLSRGSLFDRNTLDGLGSLADSSWGNNISADDMLENFDEVDPMYVHINFNTKYRIILIFPSLIPMEHANASTPDKPPDSNLEQSPSFLDTSSSRIRFACHHPQCGGRTFSRRTDRDRHARTHDDVRQYVCPACMKKFYRKDKLQSHAWKVHRIQRNSCN
jgi:hypothetical protein